MRKTPATISSNLFFWFAAQGMDLRDYLIITTTVADRIYGWSVGDKLRKLTKYWTPDPGFASGFFHGAGSESFREPEAVMPAMQISFHPDPNSGAEFVEIDFDYAAPLGGDVASLAVHAWEVCYHWLSGRKTSQERIRKMLAGRFLRAASAAAV